MRENANEKRNKNSRDGPAMTSNNPVQFETHLKGWVTKNIGEAVVWGQQQQTCNFDKLVIYHFNVFHVFPKI